MHEELFGNRVAQALDNFKLLGIFLSGRNLYNTSQYSTLNSIDYFSIVQHLFFIIGYCIQMWSHTISKLNLFSRFLFNAPKIKNLYEFEYDLRKDNGLFMMSSAVSNGLLPSTISYNTNAAPQKSSSLPL